MTKTYPTLQIKPNKIKFTKKTQYMFKNGIFTDITQHLLPDKKITQSIY